MRLIKPRKLRFDSVLLSDGWAQDVCVSIDSAGNIDKIEEGEGEFVTGHALPSMANVHSHAHQRLMQGLAERAGPTADSF